MAARDNINRDMGVTTVCKSISQSTRMGTSGLQGQAGPCPGIWAEMTNVLERFPSEDTWETVGGGWGLVGGTRV